ncbi:MAG: transposase [Geodermatophilaceae bacterium]
MGNWVAKARRAGQRSGGPLRADERVELSRRRKENAELQAFAGAAPVARASGKSRTVTRRRTKNNRLAGSGYSWAFTAAARPSPTREHYLRRRERGDGHHAALRHLFNRMLGQLHHCLRTRPTFDPIKAFPHRASSPRTGCRLTLGDIGGLKRSVALWVQEAMGR